MEDKLFDQTIKSKLERVTAPPLDGMSWRALTQKMDARAFDPHAETTILDQIAKDRLSNPTGAPYAPASWLQLAAKMDQRRTLLTRLQTSKIAEAAILLLVLLNLDAFTPYAPQWKTPPTQQHNIPVAQTDASKASEESSYAHAKATHFGANSGFAQQNAHTTTLTMQHELFSDGTQTTEDVSVVQFIAQQSATLPNTLSPIGPQESAATSRTLDLVGILPTIAPEQLKADLRNPALLPPMMRIASTKAARQYIAVFAGTDHLEITGRNITSANGFTAGVRYERRKGKWGVESGVEYQRLTYPASRNEEVLAGNPTQGFVGRTLRSLNFDMISIPVRVTRSLLKHRGTELHAKAGVQAMATVQIAPDYDAFYRPGSQPDPTNPSTPNTGNLTTDKGLWEGGTFKQNTHLVAQVGIRAERHIGRSDKRVFAEANAQKLLTSKPLGSADDSFGGIGIRLGVLAAL